MKVLSFLLPRTNLARDIANTILDQHRIVIQKRLHAIALEFEAQKALAQLQYLQSIDLSHITGDPKELS